EQVYALRAVETVDGEDEAFRVGFAVRQRLRRVRQHGCGDAGEAVEPVGDVARRCEYAACLTKSDRVEPLDRSPCRAVPGRVGELTEFGAIVVVRLPKLVEHPCHLVRVA